MLIYDVTRIYLFVLFPFFVSLSFLFLFLFLLLSACLLLSFLLSRFYLARYAEVEFLRFLYVHYTRNESLRCILKREAYH